jgi:two-component system, chemotaxis family, sensor kinase CheA
MSGDMDEIVHEFLVESYEALDRLDGDLLALEREPDSKEVLASIFRVMHTIKGTCGFLGFHKLERVAHAAESLLGNLRDGTLRVTPPIASALLATGDALRQMLAHIEREGTDGDEDFLHLVATLERLRASGGSDAPTRVPATPAAPRGSKKRPPTVPEDAPVDTTTADHDARPRRQTNHLDEEKVSLADTNIRVDVHVLDELMALAGELVLARNHLMQLTTVSDHDPRIVSAAQQVSAITSELQDGVLRTRLEPIEHAWNRFPRLIRDLAVALGKQVRVVTEGDETELDRSIIEAIRDPLTHLIRNAVDHGIETPAEREATGKPPEGLISVRASHEGGLVRVEIHDDGRGIDLERVRAKGVERGLVSAAQAERLSTQETIELIFQPGFSTAEQVTNLSGRGVGMDVVRINIANIGGTVDVSTELGIGTTYVLRIPLTLAVVPALLVHSSGQRYAIPQINVVEIVRTRASDLEAVHDAPVYRLRGRLLPLISLATELGEAPHDRATVHIVVLETEGRRFGLTVDGVGEAAEIVVKPLDAHLKTVDAYTGATVLGDGHVALILDVAALARRAHLSSAAIADASGGSDAHRSVDDVALLVFADHEGGRMALPLELVTRLERFPRQALETSGPLPVIQYGDEILHLVDVSRLLLERRHASRVDGLGSSGEALPVLVYEHDGRRVGVVVGHIVDIVRHDLDGLQPGSRPGVAGTMVLEGRVTEVLDLPQILSAWDEDALAALGTIEELSA